MNNSLKPKHRDQGLNRVAVPREKKCRCKLAVAWNSMGKLEVWPHLAITRMS
jgi:hypothetical protein